MGQPNRVNPLLSLTEYIGQGSKPAELKHLSRRRKRNLMRFPEQRRAKRDKAQTKFFRIWGCRTNNIDLEILVEYAWKGKRYRVIAPQTKDLTRQSWHLSRAGHVKPGLNLGGPPSKAKYSLMTDSEPVPRGKGEKNPVQGSEIEPETSSLQTVEGLCPF